MGLNNPEVTAIARENLVKAAALLGDCNAQERAHFEASSLALAEKYGVTEPYFLVASELVAEGAKLCDAKMASFWAARRFYAPENDGGMREVAEALEEENAIRGDELDEEEYRFRMDWESRQ